MGGLSGLPLMSFINSVPSLIVPSILIQGDKPRFAARLHHSGVMGTAEIKLATYAGGREAVGSAERPRNEQRTYVSAGPLSPMS